MEVRFSAPVEPATLKGVHATLAQLWAEEPSVAPDDRMLFATAVAEVATNIIKHRQAGSRSEMALTLRIDGDRIEATFSDNGVAVDMSRASDTPLHELAESGRGLVIAGAALDELRYERVGLLNLWHLMRRRSGGAAGRAAGGHPTR